MYSGLASWMAYILALVQQFGSHLFAPGSQGFQWQQYDGEYHLVSAKLPELSNTGTDIISALMTAVHNVMIYLAQMSTTLPAQPPQS